ncbi:MAG: sigma-70 family RNA polymerase sigma factor [Planctomycetota bacterium]
MPEELMPDPRPPQGGGVGVPPMGGFTELYDPVAPAIYTWARLHIGARLRRSIDPEDVLQEVFCRAYLGFANYDKKRPFRGWLFGIANNVLREALRGLKARGESVFQGTREGLERVADQATSISSRVVRDEKLQLFVDEVADLGDEDRRLLIYRGLEGLGHKEVATLLQLTTVSAEKRWQRLRSRLRKRGVPAGIIEDA